MSDDLDAKLEKLRRLQELKASMSPQEEGLKTAISDAVKYGPGFLKEQGQNAFRGIGNLVAEVPKVFSNAVGLPNALIGAITGKGDNLPNAAEAISAGARKALSRELPIDPNETPEQARMRRFSEGVGAGLLGAPSLGALPAAATAGGMATLGGEAGGNLAEKTGLPRAAGEIPGSLIAGILAGYATGPRQSPAQREIREAAEGTNWGEVSRNVDDLIGSGAKTATLGEAFPQGSGVRDLVGIARSGTASNALKERMTGRADDMTGLGKEFLNRIGPEVDPNAVAGQAVGKANETRAVLERMRSREFGEALKGQTLTPAQSFTTYRRLVAEAKAHPDPDYREALVEVAKKFLDEHKRNQPITDVQTLSLRLKRLKDAEASPTAATGTVINKMDTKKAVSYAEELLGQLSPAFEKANQQFAAASRNIDEQLSGGFGRLADKNPLTASEPTVAKLNPLFSSGSPEGIAQALAQLQTPGPVFGPAVKGADVTRAWSQQKLDRAPAGSNPGETLRGGPNSPANERIAAALTASGKDPRSTMQPLRAADLMQDAPLQGGTKANPKILPLQWLIRTLRSADMTVTGKGLEKMDKEIARLLADPANLAEVRKIAMFDPAVRRQLSIYAPVLSTGATSEGQ